MDLSPTDISLVPLDLFKADEKYDFKLTDILRKRQRPIIMIIDENGDLVFSSLPDGTPEQRPDSRTITPGLMRQALVEAQRLLQSETHPVASVLDQLVVNKPGERCALVVLENQFCCLRLFSLEGHGPGNGRLYAALLETMGDPQTGGVDLEKVKALFRLSKREADVVEALMSGGTDKSIARRLGVSVETIRAYLKSVRAKLGVSTRTAIVSLVHGLRDEKLSSNAKSPQSINGN